MNRSLTKRIVSLLERRQLKETLARIAMVLSCLAIFFITYLLIAPVLTQEWVAKCGMEEHAHTDRCYTLMPAETGPGMPGHIHTDDCYSIVRVDSVCPIEEHVHNDGCYSVVRGNNICGGVEHVHSSGCYSTVRGENVCGRTEHVHSDGCWDAEGNLLCGMEEHFHEDSCFAHHEELVCAMQEHVHSDSCFEQERVLVCMREEHIHSDDCCSICGMKQHIHTGACYDGLGNLLCGMEGHIHTDICFPNERKLICGMEETAWQEPEMIPVLTCGVEEHTHTSECYSIGEDLPAYTCGFLTEHVHSADCYFESGELKCTIPEHVHNESCLPAQQPETPDGTEDPTAPDGGAEGPANGDPNAGNYICGYVAHIHNDSCLENGEWICALPEHVHNESCLPVQHPETPGWSAGMGFPDVLPEGYMEVYSVPMGATFGPEETGEELTTLVYAPQNAFGGEMAIFVPQPLEALEDGGYTYTAAMDALAGAGTGSDAIVTALDMSFMSAYSYQSLSPDTSTGPVFVRLTMPAELPEGAVFLFPSVLNPCCLLSPYLPVLLQLLRSSLLYVWDLSMAFPCSLLQCQKTIRLVMPWRIYSNSIFAHCSGRGSLSGYLYSNACTPVILSVEMTWLPSWPDSYALRYILHILFYFLGKEFWIFCLFYGVDPVPNLMRL